MYNTDCIHVAYAPSSTGRWDETEDTLDEDEVIFKKYVQYPIKREPFIYDIILVDGVARIGCLENIHKVSHDRTLVLLHDGEREYYEKGVKTFVANGGYYYGGIKSDGKFLKVLGYVPVNDSWFSSWFEEFTNTYKEG